MFDVPLQRYMMVPVRSIAPTATLAHVRERLLEHRLSALPVLDDRERSAW
ncbi:MAG TPA: hypothetical protein RMH99_33075 [Sandaracinaceae bacterium LLY-WYZ-13_1]|nr:hypothetical protein [Sandaracinaceae bacterium LLY-WYZ-13_1]